MTIWIVTVVCLVSIWLVTGRAFYIRVSRSPDQGPAVSAGLDSPLDELHRIWPASLSRLHLLIARLDDQTSRVLRALYVVLTLVLGALVLAGPGLISKSSDLQGVAWVGVVLAIAYAAYWIWLGRSSRVGSTTATLGILGCFLTAAVAGFSAVVL